MVNHWRIYHIRKYLQITPKESPTFIHYSLSILMEEQGKEFRRIFSYFIEEGTINRRTTLQCAWWSLRIKYADADLVSFVPIFLFLWISLYLIPAWTSGCKLKFCKTAVSDFLASSLFLSPSQLCISFSRSPLPSCAYSDTRLVHMTCNFLERRMSWVLCKCCCMSSDLHAFYFGSFR